MKGSASMNELAAQEAELPAKAFPLTRRGVISFSLVVATIFTILFLIITTYFREQSLSSVFATGQPPATQMILGLLLGSAIAVLIFFIFLKAPVFAHLRNFFREILDRIRPTGSDILMVALFAGVGEELFFRATLQPWLG